MQKRLTAFVLALLCAGCSESTKIRTYPPNAKVTVNDVLIGVSPVEYSVPSWSMGGKVFAYRIEHDGYLPTAGRLKTRVAPGRIVAAVSTACITCLFHGFKEFEDQTNVELIPIGGQVSEVSGQKASEAPGRTVADRLRRIQDLYDQGLMTEQEYKRYRSEILHDAAGVPEPMSR
jgi:hypothetical protein